MITGAGTHGSLRGGYIAECEANSPCWAQGTSGGGVAFKVPPGATWNFTVCNGDADDPQCLGR